MMMEVRIDRGIDVMTIRVLRQDPRNSRIMSAVRQPAIAPSRTTPVMVARTKDALVEEEVDLEARREAGQNLGHQLPRLNPQPTGSSRCRCSGWAAGRSGARRVGRGSSGD